MRVRLNLSALRETHWSEYAIRFVLGGVATALTGLIARVWGPEAGGLFLAFPAIFFASATLVEKHESQRKQQAGLRGERRGQGAAALEASGTALGSIGLLGFGATVWLFARSSGWGALGIAFAVWCIISLVLWSMRRVVRWQL